MGDLEEFTQITAPEAYEMYLKQSVVCPFLLQQGMEIEALCHVSAEIGFASIELWMRGDDFVQVVQTAKRHNLIVASMIGHQPLEDGLNKPEHHDRIELELVESIDLAVQYGIPGLICFSGNRNEGQSDLEGLVCCAQMMRRVAPYAEENGVNLNVELLNSKVDHPGYQCDRAEWGVALCDMVNSPRVKLLFDIYHMQIMEGDIIRTIRKSIGHIGHFHTAGNPGRNELDDTQELNYSGICRAIVDTGYDGYIGHELIPTGDPVAALRQAFAVCHQS